AARRFENSVRTASAAPGSEPQQSATLEWRGDSVLAEVRPGGAQRLRTRAGSLPYLNPSVILLERIVQRGLRATPPLDSLPVFGLAGGRTQLVEVRRVGSDSAYVTLGPVQFRLRLDAAGGIVSGAVPAQAISIEQVADVPE